MSITLLSQSQSDSYIDSFYIVLDFTHIRLMLFFSGLLKCIHNSVSWDISQLTLANTPNSTYSTVASYSISRHSSVSLYAYNSDLV